MRKFLVLLLLVAITGVSSAKLFDYVEIRVNKKILTARQVDKFTKILKATNPAAARFKKEDIKRQLADILVLEYYLEKKNKEVRDKDITRRLNQLVDQRKLKSVKDLAKLFSAQLGVSLTVEELKDFFKKQLTLRQAQRLVVQEIIMNDRKKGKENKTITPPSDKELRAIYNRQKRAFVAPMQVTLAHIVKIVPRNASFSQILKVERELNRVRARILAQKGLKRRTNYFYRMVEQHASVIYKRNRGNLGEFDNKKLASLYPLYYKAIQKLRTGSVSKLVVDPKSGTRSIVIVLKKRGGGILPFEKVKSRISYFVLMQKGAQVFKKWIGGYVKRENYQISIQ